MALTKLTKNLIDGTFGTEWVSTIQTSNFTAEAAKGYFVNTTSAEITVNLPAGVVGSEIVIQDYAGTFATNKVLLNANGSEKIQGDSTNQGQIITNNATAKLIYQDATKGWTSQDVSLVPTTVTTTYLVVAGGGGGGGAGGGGAGGLLTGTHNFSYATNYLLTLGAGGAGATNGNDIQGTNGNNVSLATIAATIGGGGGGAYGYSVSGSGNGKNGGSGGGAGFYAGVNPTGGTATSGQGNAGGNTVRTAANPYTASGGGGAGAAGSSDSGGNSGNGGIGVASSINGTSYYWAGGGGGGAQGSGTVAGDGGNGGGGGGANYDQSGGTGTGGAGLNAGGNGGCCVSNAIGGAGGANTGGGGGGMGVSVQTAGAGGSGIIIMRYPTSSGTITIAGGLTSTTATSGSDTIVTFTGGTGNIQFN